jgi:hypothetical protein
MSDVDEQPDVISACSEQSDSQSDNDNAQQGHAIGERLPGRGCASVDR